MTTNAIPGLPGAGLEPMAEPESINTAIDVRLTAAERAAKFPPLLEHMRSRALALRRDADAIDLLIAEFEGRQ